MKFVKLHEIARRARELGLDYGQNRYSMEQREQLMEQLHMEWKDLYQEIEMDDPLVETQEDVSTTRDVVGLHSHAYYEIIFIRSGNLQYLIGTQRYRVQRGDVLLIAPGVSHRPLFLERLQEKYTRVVIWLSDEGTALLQAQWPCLAELHTGPRVLRTGDLPTDSIAAYDAMFRRGVREYTAREPGWDAAVFANTLQLFVSLYRDFGRGRVVQPPAEKRELLDDIMSYVEDHLAERITLADTAGRFHVSESTVSQLFRKRMGVSWYRYVTQRRLIAAKTLIKQGVVLEEVSETVGFSDYSGFYRAFKHEYGISPAKFKTL